MSLEHVITGRYYLGKYEMLPALTLLQDDSRIPFKSSWFHEQGQAVYAAEAERLRHWAEGREKSPVTAAMELAPSGAWVSLLSSSVLCVYVILSNISAGGSPPGT